LVAAGADDGGIQSGSHLVTDRRVTKTVSSREPADFTGVGSSIEHLFSRCQRLGERIHDRGIFVSKNDEFHPRKFCNIWDWAYN